MIKEKYTKNELRFIYKDAKYNWSYNCEPLYLATKGNDSIYILKEDGELKLYCMLDGTIKYDDVHIYSFKSMIRLYEAFINLLKEEN